MALALNAWYDFVFDTSAKCCTGVMVSASSGSMYRHMVMTLLTYHLSSVSNLYLILDNLLLFVSLDVGLGLGSQVLVNITDSNDWLTTARWCSSRSRVKVVSRSFSFS